MVPRNDPVTLPTSEDPGGLCPRCDRITTVAVRDLGWTRRRYTTGGVTVLERVLALGCRGCDQATILVEERSSDRWVPLHWWPSPGGGHRDEAIPEMVWKAYEEGVRCLGIKVPNAAAAMLRSALAQVVQDKGSDEAKGKRSLKDAVKQMVDDGSLYPTFKEWADHIRELGNAGAHPEVFGDVTMEEATDLQELVGQLLNFLYVQPAAIERARAARLAPKDAQTAGEPESPPEMRI